MKRRLLIAALFAVLALAGVAASQAETLQKGNVRVKFDADFDPHSLPRRDAAPVHIHIQGGISTTDGSHPPSLQWLEVELNRNGKLSTVGLPVCSAPLLQSTTTEEALARCGTAVVGRGTFHAEVALTGDVPTSGKLVAFNSRLHDKPALLLHFFAQTPVRFTLIVPLTIIHKQNGEFGTLLRTRVPRLAGGLGSITQIDITLGRRYSAAGKRRSYLSAACSALPGTNLAFFAFARARFRFESTPEFDSKLLKVCRVRNPK
ncbi:MAG TPA: hypothetical protein VFJ65_12560 [Solirubrobacterales bacterium]|nr:hypothetical protein [Solirubrobacterales bacterium]